MNDPLPVIMAAIQAALVSANTAAGERVYLDRYPKPPELMPCLLVYPLEESLGAEELGPEAEVEHELTVAVTAVGKTADPTEAELLSLRAQVRDALEDSPPLGGLVADLQPVKSDWPPTDFGELSITALRLQYHVRYQSQP